jgi:putative oxidoreductase
MNIRLLLFARACMSAIFIWSGVGKLMAPEATAAYIAAAGLPAPDIALAGAIIVEIGAGVALLAGFRVSWAAGLLSVFCVVTALVFHADFGDEDQLVHFFKNIAIAGGLTHLAVAAHARAPEQRLLVNAG